MRSVTVYVAEDGGDFRIWLPGTAESAAVYSGRLGHTYEFLVLGTDNAGNRETPPPGATAPLVDSGINLGVLPSVLATTPEDLPDTIEPPADVPANPLFVQAQILSVPSIVSGTRPAEYAQVLTPFEAESFATGIRPSYAGLGPMALLPLADGGVLASGGAARNELYRLGREGGRVDLPWATLPHPVFALAQDSAERLWATTGGGPLLELDPDTGRIKGEYGDLITQAIAVDPATGLLYVSSGNGIETFDPTTSRFRHFSDVRVGSLAFAADGTLWGAAWPQRGAVLRFDNRGRAEVMLRLGTPVDSLAFGQADTDLAGLLFISNNSGRRSGDPSDLIMVDVASRQALSLARGGSRGDVVATTADGRVLVSLSQQIDVLSPLKPPRVAFTNPPNEAVVFLPQPQLAVTFDRDMFVGAATDPASVLNPANYELRGMASGKIGIRGVAYDRASRTAVLQLEFLDADSYELRVFTSVKSDRRLTLAEPYLTSFTALSEFTELSDVRLSRGRVDAARQTVTYDLTLTNQSDFAFLEPLVFGVVGLTANGAELRTSTREPDNGISWQHVEGLDEGRLQAGQSTRAQTVTIYNPSGSRLNFRVAVFARHAPNAAPVFDDAPLPAARVGAPWQAAVLARDPEAQPVSYLLIDGPDGLSLDPSTGTFSWTPGQAAPADARVVVQAYDPRGGRAEQEFTIVVEGGNHPPLWDAVSSPLLGREGEPLELRVSATDVDADRLVYWADRLPPGASFQSLDQTLRWTPGPGSAGTYPDVRFFVSDGKTVVSQSLEVLVSLGAFPPELRAPAERTIREGDSLRLPLEAHDPKGLRLTYSSSLLPSGAFLDPSRGILEWTPGFAQHGVFEIPVTVSNGAASTTKYARITVLNVNAPPRFDDLGQWRVLEDQLLVFNAFAFDPDNPAYEPASRLPGLAGGELAPTETVPATVSYHVDGLPTGAVFNPATTEFRWQPDYDQAGEYFLTFVATDSGDGTGQPQSDTRQVRVVIVDANRPPDIDGPDRVVLGQDETRQIDVSAIDPDGDPVQFVLAGVPDFVTFEELGNGLGRFIVSPVAGDRGDYPIELIARDDGRGAGSGNVRQSRRTFVVSVVHPNEGPQFDPQADKLAVIGQPFRFLAIARDPDQDPLEFSATGLPPGATFTATNVYGRAVFEWTPAAADAGVYDLQLQVADSGNGDPTLQQTATQNIRLTTRPTNRAPQIAPLEEQSVNEGQALRLVINATDPDGDPLSFTSSNLPARASLDTLTGELVWTPTRSEDGLYEGIVINASDGAATTNQALTIRVRPINHPPVLTALQPQVGREDALVQFQFPAQDADGDPLTFRAAAGLPTGAVVNAQTGEFRWKPGFEQAGEYVVAIEASDPDGLRDELSVSLFVDNVNRAPTLQVANHRAVVGAPLSFRLVGNDSDLGTTPIFSALGLPVTASLDSATGEFGWTPGPADIGERVIQFQVSDGALVTLLSRSIIVSVEPVLPSLRLELTPSFAAFPGQTVAINVLAESVSGIASIALEVDGQPVPVSPQGQASFVAPAPGRYIARAVVADLDGFQQTAETVIKVRDEADSQPPQVKLDSRVGATPIRRATSIVGTVQDAHLDDWRLEIAPLGTDQFVQIGSGTSVVFSGVLTTLDAANLANGFYQLRLTARDLGGKESQADLVIEVNSVNKVAQYRRVETDGLISLGGTSWPLEREYDSLANESQGLLGEGWRFTRFEFRIQDNVPSTERESLGVFTPYREGTRVYLTLPDGRRVGFTFAPSRGQLPGITYYRPEFLPDQGVDYQLNSADTLLTRAADRYYDLQSGAPYHPADPRWNQSAFVLTGPGGESYELDARGRAVALISPSGTRLEVSQSGATSTDGQSVDWISDSRGRLSSITFADGNRILYQHDAADNLVAVRDLGAGASSRYGYAQSAPGRLILAVEPGTGRNEAIEYRDAPLQTPLVADLGGAGQFLAAPTLGVMPAGQTADFAFALRDTEVAATASGALYLGFVISPQAGSPLNPGLPMVQGLTPVFTRTTNDEAFAIYRFESAGLFHLQCSGASPIDQGPYRLQIVVLGDVNRTQSVDGLDALGVQLSLGSVRGDARYNEAADADRNGQVDLADQQLLSRNDGFAANRPPQLSAGQVRTHRDLRRLIDLAPYVVDPEDDPLYFRLISSTHGTATLTGDGRSVLFVPEPAYTGVAEFALVADDGYGQSAPVSIVVEVSAAPLIRLRFDNRSPILFADINTKLTLTGDFADEPGVPLPAGYLQFVSSNPAVASVSQDGRLTGESDGTTLVTASGQGISTTMSVTVGFPSDRTEQTLFIYGLDVFPDAVTLAGAYDSRQLIVTLDGLMGQGSRQADLATALAGTQYFVGNPSVITVSADGRITALAAGQTEIVVINGPAQLVIPVRVDTPTLNSALISAAGGAVAVADGTVIAIPEGALSAPVTVSLLPRSVDTLPLELPTWLEPVAAFELDLAGKSFSLPAQLAVPVPPTIPAGTKLYLNQLQQLPDEAGVDRPIWIAVDIAEVGVDGIARTTSPPFPGLTGQGLYHLARVSGGEAVAQIVADQIADPLNWSYTYVGIGSFGVNIPTGLLNLTLPIAPVRAKVNFVPRSGPVVSRDIEFTVFADRTTTVRLTLPDVPLDVSDPRITSVRVDFTGPTPELIIEGKNLGTPDDTYLVHFQLGGDDSELILPDAPDAVSSAFRITRQADGQVAELRGAIPRDIPIGLALISVERQIRDRLFTRVLESRRSDAVRLPAPGGYVFVAQQGNGAVSVLSATPKPPGNGADQMFIASIPLSDGLGGRLSPRHIALTSDMTRAYVTTLQGKIAVIDTITLQQIDTFPSTPAIDSLDLPAGALPFQIVIEPRDTHAYASDEVGGTVYSITIDPTFETYHDIFSISVGPAPYGLRGLDVTPSGNRLFVAAPNRSLFGGGSTSDTSASADSSKGHILVVDLDPFNKTRWEQVDTIVADQYPYDVKAVGSFVTFTNYKSDGTGFGVIRGSIDRQRTVDYIAVDLGPSTDRLDVNNARAIAITPDLKYAFVAGWNIESYDSKDHEQGVINFGLPAGSTIGIITDPLNGGRLVAATRSIPFAFPYDLELTPDGGYLYVNYGGIKVSESDYGSILVYNVAELRREVEQRMSAPAGTERDLNIIAVNNRIENFEYQSVEAIDVRADYRINPKFDPTPPPKNSAYGVQIPEQAPIGLGGFTRGLAVQDSLLKLKEPVGSTDMLRPTFRWEVDSPLKGIQSKLYVSVFSAGNGLWPDDSPDKVTGEDLGRNRILSAPLDLKSDQFSYDLPENLQLTAGQTYYWGVEVKLPDGRVTRQWTSFETDPVTSNVSNNFPSVTIITHGYVPPTSFNSPNAIEQFVDMAADVLRAGGGEGTILRYDPRAGSWSGGTPQAGSPLVLVTDWIDESDLDDSGFSEAAADAIFAGLWQLDVQTGGALFSSPLHFIGHSRGTIVNSEVVQRIGAYLPDVRDIHFTTLDPHDFVQGNLNLGFLAQFGDFHEPEVQVWENVSFADNYYQTQAEPNLGGIVSLTPNGRSVPSADIDLALDGRPGFQRDDALENPAFRAILLGIPAAAGTAVIDRAYKELLDFLRGTDPPEGSLGVGPHSRVWRWYAGTIDLSADTFPADSDEAIYRRLEDKAKFERLGGNEGALPWYAAREYSAGTTENNTLPTEGIGEGWAFSLLGGNDALEDRPARPDKRIPLTDDNTNPDEQNVLTDDRLTPVGVASVFNGNFEQGTIRRGFRTILATLDRSETIPGWSFHGGYSGDPKKLLGSSLLRGEGSKRIAVDGLDLPGSGRPNHVLELGRDFGLGNLVTHNRMLFPAQANLLQFSMQVRETSSDRNQLAVWANLWNSETGQYDLKRELTQVSIDSTSDSFTIYEAILPADVVGQVGTLTFELRDAIDPLRTPTATIWIDDVRLVASSTPNQPPVNNVPLSAATTENTTLVFSAATNNAIAISDPDASRGRVEVALSVTNGTISLASLTGVSLIVGVDGQDEPAITVRGTLDAINGALDGLSYLPAAGFSGSSTLSVSTSDLGNTGVGGPLTDTDQITIAVNAAIEPASLAEVSNVPAGVNVTGQVLESLDTSGLMGLADDLLGGHWSRLHDFESDLPAPQSTGGISAGDGVFSGRADKQATHTTAARASAKLPIDLDPARSQALFKVFDEMANEQGWMRDQHSAKILASESSKTVTRRGLRKFQRTIDRLMAELR